MGNFNYYFVSKYEKVKEIKLYKDKKFNLQCIVAFKYLKKK